MTSDKKLEDNVYALKREMITVDVEHQNNYQHRFFFDNRDSEEECIERIQRLIDRIYKLNPNLDYECRPHIFLRVNCEEEDNTEQVRDAFDNR